MSTATSSEQATPSSSLSAEASVIQEVTGSIPTDGAGEQGKQLDREKLREIEAQREELLSKREKASQYLLSALRRQMGEELFNVFQDERVTEIYVNSHEQNVRLDTHTKRGKYISSIKFPDRRLEQFLHTATTFNGGKLSKFNPVLEGELPEKWFSRSRIEGFIPNEIVEKPSVVIRKPPTQVYSLESYVENGFMEASVCEQIHKSVRQHHNIIVCGGTGSGKTTLTNGIILAITEAFEKERLVILEDTRELQCEAEDHQFLRTSKTAGIEMRDLVKYTLRCFPDRILVGECRDETALEMLDAWSTGHPGGVCTLHANSALGALERLDSLSQRANVPPQPSLVGRAVDLVVRIQGGNQGRSIPEVARVHGYSKEHSGYVLEDIHGRDETTQDATAAKLLQGSNALYLDDYR